MHLRIIVFKNCSCLDVSLIQFTFFEIFLFFLRHTLHRSVALMRMP